MLKSYNGFTADQREEGDKILKKAISEGKLLPPSKCKCYLCGQDKGIRHYHCEDYSEENILDDSKVLCWRCHMMVHTRFRHPRSFGEYMLEVVINGKQYPPVYKGDAWDELKRHYVD